MTMAFGAEQLRKSDDPKDQEVAKLLEAALALRGKDVPLPGSEIESAANETKTELGKVAIEHGNDIDEIQPLPLVESFPDAARFATTEEPIIGLSLEAPANTGELAAELQDLPEVQAVVAAAHAKAAFHPDEKEKRAKWVGGDKYIQWDTTRTVEGKKDAYYENKLTFDAETKEPKILLWKLKAIKYF